MPPAPSADMPIDKEFQNELRLLCEAGVRVIHLVSHEWERLRACLLELRTEGLHKNQPIVGWSPTKGIYAIEPGRHNLKDVIDNTLIGASDILATIKGKNADVDAIHGIYRLLLIELLALSYAVSAPPGVAAVSDEIQA